MKKFVYILISIVSIVGALFGIYKIYYNNSNKSPIDSNPIISIPQKPTEPYGFDYLDNWQKDLYRLIERDTLQIGEEYSFAETKTLDYVEMVINLYNKNNPTRPIMSKMYNIIENYQERTRPDDPLFKENISLGTTNKIKVSQWANSNIDEELKTYKELDKKANEIIAMIPENANEYDKLYFIFEYLKKNVDYDNDTAKEINIDLDSGRAYGALVKKKALCGGVSQAFQYLATKAGFYTLYIESVKLNHAWNRVWFNNQFYRIDVSLGSFLVEDNINEDYIPGIPLQKINNHYKR